MKNSKLKFVALFVLFISSQLLVGCKSQYDGVPGDARVYWDYIIDQYANPECLQYDDGYSFVIENGTSGMSLFYIDLLFQIGKDEDERIQYMTEKYGYSNALPHVKKIKVLSEFSREFLDLSCANLQLVNISYRYPDQNGKYQDYNEMFMVPLASDIAYIFSHK